MGLIGWEFPTLLVTVTVLAFVGLVLVWPRLSRNAVLTVAGRAGGVLLVNVLVVSVDRDSYPTSSVLLRDVRSPTAATATVLQNAGHRTSVWIQLLPTSLTWLGANVPGFRPGS